MIGQRPSDPVVHERVRGICMGVSGTTEKLSHGEAAWFVGGRQFATMADHHHDQRLAIWCAAPPGAQEELIDHEPDLYFRPPYVGHRGWVGIWLDADPPWDEVASVLAAARDHVANRPR